MKLGKLLTVTALATGIALGAFVNSVEARTRRVSRYSLRARNEYEVKAIFTLIDSIEDTTPGDLNIGEFPEAIRDYTVYPVFSVGNPSDIGESVNFNPKGFPIDFSGCGLVSIDFSEITFNESGDVVNPSCANTVEPIETFDKLDLTATLISNYETSSGSIFDQVVEYEFGSSIIRIDVSSFTDEKKIQAVNSLSNISSNITNFNLIENVSENTAQVEETIETVPESNTANSIIVLGFIGGSLLISKKFKICN